MARINPQDPKAFKSNGEETVFNFIKSELPDEYTAFYNYRVNGQEFDMALIVPGRGIVIIEIKGHSLESILKVKDNENIILYNNESLYSPLKQADKYRYSLISKINETYGDLKIPVLPMVCYPYIGEEGFCEKRLDIISAKEETLLKEDIEDSELAINKIKSLLDRYKKGNVSTVKLRKVIKLFEDTKITKSEDIQVGEVYSLLISIKEDDDYEKQVSEIINLWSKGSKIILFSESDKVLNYTRESLKERISKLFIKNRKDFEIKDDTESLFNFNMYKVPGKIDNKLKIIDGDINFIKKREKLLTRIDEVTNFNLKQYKIEHAPIERDIVVRAGAGTGKTYSMISRINYLIYKHNLDESNLKDSIILITFTNEAAKNMKRRLQESLINRYFVTKDYSALQMVECVENMNICTIHSLTKKILKKYAIKLGLGEELKVTSGVYELTKVIDEVTNEYLKNNTYLKENNTFGELNLYKLKDRVNQLTGKLANKNLDIVNDSIDFGYIEDGTVDRQEIASTILEIAKESEKRVKENSCLNNSVRLNDLMMKLKLLVNNHYDDLKKEQSNLKYVFVDEYQDTDDVQINLMKQFQDVLGFNLFVVGDIKQCIYRFRGAEDKAFDILQRDRKKFIEESLNKNYRSDRKLLDEYHDIFANWNDKDKSLEYDKEKDKLTGVKSFSKDKNLIENIVVDTPEDIERELINKIRYCKENLSRDESVAILVRENNQIEEIKRMVNKPEYSDIYIETDIGGDLYKIEPTLDLYKLVMALEYNKDPKYLLNLYTTSYVNNDIFKIDIYKIRNNKSELLKLFNDKYVISGWNEYIDRLKLEPVMKVIRDIISNIKPWNNYGNKFENDLEKSININYYKANLEQIIEKIIASFDNDYLTVNKLQQFLEIMITTKQSDESRSELSCINDENRLEPVIKCMTVHKSKGLEFDVVIMPYCSTNIADSRKKGYVDIITRNNKVGYYLQLPKIAGISKGKEGGFNAQIIQNNYYKEERKTEVEDRKREETRILYVAMTRAIKEFVYFEKKDVKDITWQSLIKGE